MHVLLSIRPVHVQNILNGTKVFEFRKRVFARTDICTVLIYCTKPIGLLVAEFDIAGILKAEPDELWVHTRHGSGISKSYFDTYFQGRSVAYAIQIGEVRTFKAPIEPAKLFSNFTPPQSYTYVSAYGSDATVAFKLAY